MGSNAFLIFLIVIKVAVGIATVAIVLRKGLIPFIHNAIKARRAKAEEDKLKRQGR